MDSDCFNARCKVLSIFLSDYLFQDLKVVGGRHQDGWGVRRYHWKVKTYFLLSLDQNNNGRVENGDSRMDVGRKIKNSQIRTKIMRAKVENDSNFCLNVDVFLKSFPIVLDPLERKTSTLSRLYPSRTS